MMNSLNESAKTPFIFLFLSGVVMVYALATSKKSTECGEDFRGFIASGRRRRDVRFFTRGAQHRERGEQRERVLFQIYPKTFGEMD